MSSLPGRHFGSTKYKTGCLDLPLGPRKSTGKVGGGSKSDNLGIALPYGSGEAVPSTMISEVKKSQSNGLKMGILPLKSSTGRKGGSTRKFFLL
jgi:hypothetical protein